MNGGPTSGAWRQLLATIDRISPPILLTPEAAAQAHADFEAMNRPRCYTITNANGPLPRLTQQSGFYEAATARYVIVYSTMAEMIGFVLRGYTVEPTAPGRYPDDTEDAITVDEGGQLVETGLAP